MAYNGGIGRLRVIDPLLEGTMRRFKLEPILRAGGDPLLAEAEKARDDARRNTGGGPSDPDHQTSRPETVAAK